MKIKLTILFIAATTLLTYCSSGTQTQNNDTADATDSADAVSTSDVIFDVWRAYLTSEYCDIKFNNIDSAISLLDRVCANAATIATENNIPVDTKNITAKNDSTEDEYEEFGAPDPTDYWVYESFAVFPYKSGGYIALWNYHASSWGKKVLAVYSYTDTKLTRLKNEFPPLSDDLVDKNPPFSDEIAKLNGSEVIFLMQDCWTDRFKSDSFTISVGGMEDHSFKWDGEKFIQQ